MDPLCLNHTRSVEHGSRRGAQTLTSAFSEYYYPSEDYAKHLDACIGWQVGQTHNPFSIHSFYQLIIVYLYLPNMKRPSIYVPMHACMHVCM